MNERVIELSGYSAAVVPPKYGQNLFLGTYGSYGNERFNVQLGEGWDGLTVTAIFQPAGVVVPVPAGGGVIEVPWEATEKALPYGEGRIVFKGVQGDRVLISTDIQYCVVSHSDVEGGNAQPPTPDEYQQFIAEVKDDADRAEKAADEAEAAVQGVKDAAASAVKSVQTAGDDAVEKIETANAHPPIVQGGTWWTWDAASGAYTDTGTPAESQTLYATFDLDPATGLLSMTTPDGYAGPEFALNNGHLEVHINAED